MRAQYDDVVQDTQGNALEGIIVTVYLEDGTTEASVYDQPVGGTQINPIEVDATGHYQFWAESPVTYVIEYHDPTLPTRISDRTKVWEGISAEDILALEASMSTVDVGDFKESIKSVDHGRWLLCDGRSLTQAEIEDALDLEAGDALDFVTEMGTGSSSIYGNTTASKVKLPDFRGKFALNELSGSHPKKGTGSSGGVELVTLTAAESGLPQHNHTASTSISISDPGHDHDLLRDGSGNAISFYYGFSLTLTGGGNIYIPAAPPGVAFGTAGNEYVSGAATGITASGTVTVNNKTAQNASEDHENMPPYQVKGNTFIKV